MINNKIIRKLLLFMPKIIMYWLIMNNCTLVVALFYKAFIIKEKESKSGNKSIIKNYDEITILALNADKFRGDLECLVEAGNFKVLTLGNMWQTILMYAFARTKVGVTEYVNAEAGSIIDKWKNKINIFFEGFISALLKLIKIDCVITVNYRYVEDLIDQNCKVVDKTKLRLLKSNDNL